MSNTPIPTPLVTPTEVQTDSFGNIAPTKIWDNALYGQYDVVADKKKAGVYDNVFNRPTDPVDNDDVAIENINGNTAGLLVVPEYFLGGLAALGTCFAALVVIKRKSLPNFALK